jgi:tRNA nucleotidyltransferase/poly(A) polymerase
MSKFQNFLKENTDFKAQWQQYLQSNPLLRIGVDVLEIITKLGYKAYIVGGAVRDIVIGTPMHDVDIATNCPMNILSNTFTTYDIGQSKDFGILLIKHKGISMEVAQFRKDGSYMDGRRPDKVHICQDFQEDASRRDFCINALGIDKDGNILDYFDGVKDIKNKILRSVGDPEQRFKEDNLRQLRAVRFAAKLGFTIDPDTKAAIEKHKTSITMLAPERIKDELMKVASDTGKKFANALKIFDDVGILDIILPELTKLKNTKETPEHHPEAYKDGGKGTVWDHTLAALSMNTIKDPLINLAIALHDVGKAETYKFIDGKHTYYDHAEKSKDIIDSLAKRLKLSNKERDAILFASMNHMKMFNGNAMKPSKIIALVNNENWPLLQAVSLADDSCRIGMFNRDTFNTVVKDMEYIARKWGEKTVGSLVKVVDGKRVMRMTGLPAGKVLGDLIKRITAYAVDNGISSDKEIDTLIMKFYSEIK